MYIFNTALFANDTIDSESLIEWVRGFPSLDDCATQKGNYEAKKPSAAWPESALEFLAAVWRRFYFERDFIIENFDEFSRFSSVRAPSQMCVPLDERIFMFDVIRQFRVTTENCFQRNFFPLIMEVYF